MPSPLFPPSTRSAPSTLQRYGIAVLLSAIGILLRLALNPVLGQRVPFLFALVAVVISAWYGGVGPGVLSTLLSATVIAVLPPPHNVPSLAHPGDLTALALYLFTGALISGMSEARTRAERHFRHSQERHLATLEALNEGYASLDGEWRFVYANATAERLLGRPREALVGQLLPELFPELWGLLATAAQQAVQSGKPVEQQLYYAEPAIWLDARLFRTQRGLALFFRDITAARRDAEALRESNERFHQAAAVVDGSVYDWDKRKNTLVHTEGIQRLVGFTQEEMGGDGAWWTGRIHPDDRLVIEAAFQEAQRAGARQCATEYRIRHRDGSYRWIWDQAMLLRDEDGEVVRLIGTTVDITGRKRAEGNLRFLARASEELAASLDYEATLAVVARLAVPHIADWCAVDLQEAPGAPLRRLAVAHVDPAKVEWAHELERRYPPDPNSPTGVPNVIRTGESELYTEIPEALLEAGARDAEHLEIIRSLGMTSAMVVPLSARGGQFGAITLVSAESGRRYDREDLEFAEDLGRRSGLAIDNARLFHATEAARQEAEAAQAELEKQRSAAVRQAEDLQLINEELECQREELSVQTEELEVHQRNLRAHQQRLEFLLRVSEALAGPKWSLQHLAELCIPSLCDWCIIDGVDEHGELRPRAQAAADPDILRTLEQLRAQFPPSTDWLAHPASVLSTGKPELTPAISEAEIAGYAQNPEHLELIRSLGARSRLLVPLYSRGMPLGVLTLVMSGSERRHTQDHVDLAMEAARRASLALDNQRLVADLRQANQAKENFLAILGHELRNPLAPMRNVLARWMAEAQPWPGHERDLEILNRQMAHVERLVDDLLDVSRIAQGKIELRVAPANLVEVAERAEETCCSEFERRSQRLTVTVPPDGVWVSGDATRLEQVLVNLLTNASKYTQPGGQVRLSLGTELVRGEERAVVRVRDNGIGIAPELLPRIFDLFMQADQGLDRREGGLGLGLTLVRSLVELHGGTVEARSPGPDQGSEFVVTLPVLRHAPQERTTQPTPVPSRDTGPLRVLVVDDNRDSADTLQDLLTVWGHQVEVAYEGAAALQSAAARPADVVLLDIGLPGMDGYEVARRLNELPAPPRLLVALTGYGQPQDRQRSQEAGFHHHLTKPLDVQRLRELLGEPRKPI